MNGYHFMDARRRMARAMARGECLPKLEAPLNHKAIESYMLRTGCTFAYAKLVVPRLKPTLYTRTGE